tara:strand:- start:115419 stop:115853 length:435 start_codon:yes stop_codon:yes gene_type:complete
MNNPNTTAPIWFVILAIVLTVWNLIGVMLFLQQMAMTAEQIAALPEKRQLLLQNIPFWVNIAFGFAVFAGTLGCIALALKKSIALAFLLISLVGVIVQMFHAFVLTQSYELYGPGGALLPLMVIVIALFLVWLTVNAKLKGWIN